MDGLAGLLDAPRARGAFALRVVMSSPWALLILAESPVTLIAEVAGEAWIVPDDGEPTPIRAGDVAVTRAPFHYNFADAPTTCPQVVIYPGQRCCDLAGNSVLDKMTTACERGGTTAMARQFSSSALTSI